MNNCNILSTLTLTEPEPVPSALIASSLKIASSCEVTGLIVRVNLSFDSCLNIPGLSVISVLPSNQRILLERTEGVTVNDKSKELGVTAICSVPLSEVTVGTV